MKFSIIIPVYNVEEYIIKCLESINNQSYANYEVIIVNDGSPDNSEKIINKYIKDKKKFKQYKKENGGLSDARNYGLQYVTGDYIIFIDGDDYIDSQLLINLNEKIKKQQYEVIRFGLKLVDENGKIINEPMPIKYDERDKTIAIKKIITHEYVEPAWLYAYSSKFWKENNFEYPYSRIHEDYGLTPIVLNRAKTIGFIDYNGYNYVQRKNSIMSQIDYNKITKRCTDFKEQFLNHRKEIKPDTLSDKLLLSFSAEALLYKTRELKDKEQENMIKFLKKERVISQIYPITFKKRLQKLYLNIFLKKYIKKISKEFYKSIGEQDDKS